MAEEQMSGGAGVRRADPAPAAAVAPAEPDAADPVPAPEIPVAADPEPVPVEEAPLDPRAIARASLDAGRNLSLWWTSSGIVVATVVALAVGTRAGAFVLAAVALTCAVVRAVLPSPGPAALAVRAKAIDVAVLCALGGALALFAQILPHG